MDRFKTKRILIVDDMRAVRMLVEKCLVKMGFQKENLDNASNGVEALEKIKQTPFDLVISDLNMDQMNGIELVQACRLVEDRKDTLFFILTSEIDPQRTATLIELGVKKYLVKPLSEETLMISIQNYL